MPRIGWSLLPLCAALGALHSSRGASLPAATESTDWTRGAVCYQIFVRSFHDSDGDGVGDLNGLIQRLDYVNDGDPATDSDLGARCIWLLPIAAASSYHGYDVTNHYRVNPEYGSNANFRRFVDEAHRRGIRVLVDLVLNHVSSEHPYFKEALLDTASRYRDWFRWSPRHPGVRNRWGGDNWHRSEVRDEYYYGFFWHGMPDLNYHTSAVREEARSVARFWLEEMRADGFRLDAISYLVEEGDSVYHTAGTHAFLREFTGWVRQIAPAAFTVGEVWDSTAAMMRYYPDQLDSYFAFEVSDAIVRSVRTGRARELLQPVVRLQQSVPAHRWAPFLRNHDQTRAMTALGGDPRRARVAATLLLTLPGLPFVYYGEEIGMSGDKPDPRLRTPMHWQLAKAAGFSTGVPWEPLHPDSFSANVEAQQRDPGSLLSLYRRLVRLRASNRALAGGELIPLQASSDAVTAFVRREGDDVVLVVANVDSVPAARVELSSEVGALPRGEYAVRDLLQREGRATLRVTADGRLARYVPVNSLGPFDYRIFALDPRRSR